MNFKYQILHNPGYGSANIYLCLAGLALIGMFTTLRKLLRDRKPGIETRPVPLFEEVAAANDAEEIVFPVQAAGVLSRRSTILRKQLVGVCMLTLAGSLIMATRYERIMHRWDEARTKMDAHDYTGARRVYKEAIAIDPSVRRSHLLLGQAIIADKDPFSALNELKIAANGERQYPDASLRLGDIEKVLGRYPDAVTSYREAIAIAPNRADFYVRLATLLELMNRQDDAYRELLLAVDLAPKSSAAQSALGQLLIARKQVDEGLYRLNLAGQLAPSDPTIHNNVGCGLAQAARLKDAIAEFRSALALDPDFGTAYYNLGCALRDTGDVEGAISAYRSYLEVCIRRPMFRSSVISAQIELRKLLFKRVEAIEKG